jgi:serine/threonine-protein kinase
VTRTELAPALRRLFEELVELAPRAREARLVRVRGEDRELAAEVEALLAAAETTPDFLERPAQDSELVGHLAGPWRIEARLSSGGDGDVWRARRLDGSSEWCVALKVLRRPASGPDARRRFEAERHALAALNHPYIVPLVDVGTLADGRLYLATRLVEGEPLDRAAAGLGLDARLELFLRVARAVQHAHTRLILHCDLKPSNVLVTPEGIPQMVDFGIARVLRAARSSESALTPGYASPEQRAGAALSTPSDVWSLGVVLYELVSGKRPFARAEDALRPASEAADDGGAPAASCGAPYATPRLARVLRGDLDALLARALAHDPSARYATVEALAQDLERWRAGFPLVARPAAPARRAWLFACRHPLASLAALALVTCLAVAAVALQREAARNRAEATRGWRAHAQAVFATRWIEELARAAGAGPELAAALDRARADLAREPDVPPEAEGRLRLTLGALYLDVGRPADARVELERARELTESTRGFGREDRERVEGLLARVGTVDPIAPAR